MFGMGTGVPTPLEAPTTLEKNNSFQKALMTGEVKMKNTIDNTAAARITDAKIKLDLYFNIFCTIVDYSTRSFDSFHLSAEFAQDNNF